jgi:hypothetical protein
MLLLSHLEGEVPSVLHTQPVLILHALALGVIAAPSCMERMHSTWLLLHSVSVLLGALCSCCYFQIVASPIDVWVCAERTAWHAVFVTCRPG